MTDTAKLTVKCLFCSFTRTETIGAMLAAGREHAASHGEDYEAREGRP